MPQISVCPDLNRYRQLASGAMTPEDKESLLQHLEQCGDCAARVAALPNEDTLVDLLRQARTKVDNASGEKMAALVERLSKQKPGAAARSEDKTLPPTPAAAATFVFDCPACGKKLKIKESAAGKKVNCPSCRQAVQAPEKAAPRAAEAPTVAPEAALPPRDRTSAEGTGGNAPPAEGKDRALYDFLAPPQSADELGRLGHYRVLKVLGAGGMGVVFQADEPALKRKVALKAMLPGLAASESARQRFLREAQAAAAIEHDHIVPIHYVGEDRGVPFIAMPFLRGEPLDARLEREGKLPLAEVLRIGREMAEGLAAAHERGLIHRDVKPANVWLETRRGEPGASATGGRVRILDFGLARSVEQESALTQQGAIVGTPSYMAPEQARGDPVDARSDLFSLGGVLYRLCCGKPAFQGRDTIATLMAVATEEPPPPIAVNPELPVEVSDLVMALLQKDPDRRPASAAAVVEALQDLEEKLRGAARPHNPTVALPAAAKGKAAPAKRRRRWLVAVAAGLAVLIGGLVAAQVVIQIRDKHGKVVGEYPVPEGGDARVIQAGEKADWVQLFNGKDLTGWTTHPRGPGQWKVEDGAIVSSGPASCLFSERGDYENFHCRIEAKINDGGNSGQFFRTQFGPGNNPKGYEAQIANREAYKTGSLYHFVKITEDLVPPDTWFTQEVIAEGDHITIKVNGKTTVDFVDAKNTHTKGHFAIQQHNPATVVHVRKVEVKELLPQQGAIEDAWYKHVAALPAEKQVEAVAAKLKERNPGFDGKVNFHIEKWEVTMLVIRGRVSDLSPLKGLLLTSLHCGGTKVSDLSPLKGMKLTFLRCDNTPVSDLSPLKGMPLTNLECGGTKVSDLSPLKDLPLTGLDIGGTPVSDLSPLKGMKLSNLNILHTQVSDLSPLKDIKLTELKFGDTRVSELSPLKGMKLTQLDMSGTKVSDLSGLQGMPLTSLNCGYTPVSDLSPLKGMKLTHLNIGDRLGFPGTRVSDLSPLKGMPLKTLDVTGTPVVDLSPLKGMPLGELRMGLTPVVDLSPLKGLPLWKLVLGGSKVTDLSPLHDMKVVELDIRGSKISDLSPLKGTPLKLLCCFGTPVTDLSPLKSTPLWRIDYDFKPERDAAILRSIKTLEQIKGRPVAEIWKELDAKQSPKTAVDEAWLKQVAALSQVKQVEAVAAKLKERNPGFDGRVELKKVEGSKVTEIWFSAAKVEDISPVQALVGLKALRCTQGSLDDLSALKDMKLTELWCWGTKVSDLSPLKGMPLTNLNCGITKVIDLSPLKDMKLTQLVCGSSKVTDLSPLKGMPLTDLSCHATQVSDLSPLKGKPLTFLECDHTQVSDLSPLKDMKLRELFCGATKVTDLSPLKGMPLTNLDFWGTQVSDLSPLKDMKLTRLGCAHTQVSDLSPLKGMPLTYLHCGGTKVSDLSPLKGMPLTELWCGGTKVSDLSPLKGMPLRGLECVGTKVSDLSPLMDMPLKSLWCDFKPERDAEILRSMKTLETINNKPAAQFWKEVDAKATNKKP